MTFLKMSSSLFLSFFIIRAASSFLKEMERIDRAGIRSLESLRRMEETIIRAFSRFPSAKAEKREYPFSPLVLTE